MESCPAPWGLSSGRLLMTFFAAALIEFAAAGASQEGQMQGTTLSSGGGEALFWFLPAALGAVLMLTFLVVLCASRENTHHRFGSATTTQPFLSTTVADQQAAASDHVYVNQPVNQDNRDAASPVPGGQQSPQYASLTRPPKALLQNVYVPSDDMGAEGTGPGQAQRGYEVPRVSIVQEEDGMDEPRTQPAQNEVKPNAIHLQKGALPNLPSWLEASLQTPKPSPLPSPVSSLTGRGGGQKEHKYREPPSTEQLIQENLRAFNCTIIPSRELRLGDKLGEGYFATVHSAVWTSQHGLFKVAVKKLKSRASAEERVKFLQEALIMAQFLHPNIVQLCGMTQDTMQGIILELLPNGNLKSYLGTCRKHALEYPEGQIASALLLFAQQIASGMNYLANKDFVHRDLAARNILLNAEYVCKIGDFGLARGIAGESYYKAKSGHIPVKWTAPEALEFNRYTSASDVWSYGVLLFEMWSLGRQPMADKKNAEISSHLNGGYRMAPPPGCSRGIYKLMIKCWHPDPEKRPTFGMIYGAIEVKGLALLTMDNIANRSSTVHMDANIIGAPLAAGEGLYRDLQVAYR